MRQIVVVDGYLLNPGDLSWEELKSTGNCTFYDRTNRDQVIQRCKDAEIVLTNKVLFLKEEIEQLPKLKYIGITATGTNNIDSAFAKEKQIVVTNVQPILRHL